MFCHTVDALAVIADILEPFMTITVTYACLQCRVLIWCTRSVCVVLVLHEYNCIMVVHANVMYGCVGAAAQVLYLCLCLCNHSSLLPHQDMARIDEPSIGRKC